MAQVEEIIIEVEVNAGESAKNLAAVQSKLQAVRDEQRQLKAEQRDLNRELKENGTLSKEQQTRLNEVAAAVANNNMELKRLTAEEKMHTAQLNIATQGERKYGDSLVELSAQLSELKQEYRGLSAAQREGAAGQEMLKSIKTLDEVLKGADGTLGDFQRNVGNYQSALLGLNGNIVKVSSLFAGGFKQGITAAGGALKTLGKTILTTPVGWIAAAVAAAVKVFNQLKAAFKANDEAGTELAAAMAKLQPVITAVRNIFIGLAGAVAKVVGAVTGVASAVMSFLVPSFREASKAAEALVRQQDLLEDKRREFSVNEAEREREIAALRKQAVSDETLSAHQREEIYKKIDDLSRQTMEERRKLAEENYKILKQEAEQSVDTSDEMKDRLVAAYNAMVKAQTEYLTETTRIGSRQAQARREQAKEEEEALKREQERRRAAQQEWKRQQEERRRLLDVERQEMRKLEDLRIQGIDNEVERLRQETSIGYNRQLEDLRRRLENEKNITVETRKAIEEQVVLLEQEKWQRLAALDEEELKRAAEQQIRMSEQAAAAAEETARRLAQATAVQRVQILSDYEKELININNDFESRLNAVFGSAVEQSRIEEEAAALRYENILSIDAETKAALFESEEIYKAAVIAAEGEMLAARERSAQALQSQAKEVSSTVSAVTGALSELYEAAAGDTESYEKFKKAMAIVDATIGMAQAIAAATSVSTAGDPYTLAIRIAANVAAVTAQFAAVIKAIKAAQVPSAPTFAEGGIVPGKSYKGDKLVARVNSGEMILTREQQGQLFNLIKAGVPAVGFDYEKLAEVVVKSIKELPPPVLEYRQFMAFQNKSREVLNKF